eukprot:12241835-Alexandrium_andersonii.AAC.1
MTHERIAHKGAAAFVRLTWGHRRAAPRAVYACALSARRARSSVAWPPAASPASCSPGSLQLPSGICLPP